MKVRLLIIILICFFTFPWNNAYSESKQISLEECINIAFDNHPGIRVAAEELKKSISNYDFTKSADWFRIDGEIRTVEYLKSSTSAGNYNLPGRDTVIGLFTGASLVYNLYDPNISKRQLSAKLSVDLSKTNEIKARSGILLNVKTAYYNYIIAKENVSLKEEMANKSKIKLEKTKMLFKNGQRPILDVTKAEVDLASSNLEYEKAKNMEALSKSELLSAMGISDESIDVVPVKTENLPNLKYSLSELYGIAESNYPEARIMRLTKEISRINIAVEKSARRLTVDMLASLGFENKNIIGGDAPGVVQGLVTLDNWKPAFHAGVQARLPIFDGGAIGARVDGAKADYNKSLYTEKQILLNMKTLIRSYLLGMEELKKQIELSKLMKINAEKHLILAQKSYDNGIGSQIDLKDAETAVLNAELFSIRAKYDYLIILAKLSNTVGLGEEYLCEK